MSMNHVHSSILVLILTMWSLSCSSAAVDERVTTIVVVRHAEKLSGRDPSLSKAGRKRAIKLATKLETFNLAGVYTSKYKRTLETAVPTADKFDLSINSRIDPRNYQALLSDVLANHSGGAVLIVGHSDTMPRFIRLVFPSEKRFSIPENEYSNFFILKLVGGVGSQFVRERY